MNTNGTIADLSKSSHNKRLQRQRAKRVQRRREKEAWRHREKSRANPDELKRLAWPIKEGARRAGVGRTTIYKLAAQHKIRLIKILGRTLLPDSELVRLVEDGCE